MFLGVFVFVGSVSCDAFLDVAVVFGTLENIPARLACSSGFIEPSGNACGQFSQCGPNPENVEKTVQALKSCVTAALKDASLNVDFNRSGNLLAWQFKTMKFDLYPVNDGGVAGPKKTVVDGPQADGFILQIHVGRPFRPAIPGSRKADAYAKTRMTYWDQFHVNYSGARVSSNMQTADDPPFRLEFQYGKNANKELLRDILERINRQFTPPDRI